MESEIEDVVNPVIDKNRVYLKLQLKRYGIWWSVLLAVFILSFATGNWHFSKSENKNKNVGSTKEVKVLADPAPLKTKPVIKEKSNASNQVED